MNFDAVKLDGCGRQRNLTFYAQLMQATGKNYSIENCHWGDCTHGDDSSCPTLEWCPFNWYRSSGDINSGHMSWFDNLQTTIRFQSWDAPVSRPGCWAYPDMLEVGRVQGSLEWNRAHFGAWCIVSAPLILGVELTTANLEPIIPIISNTEALAVNQAWAGHPGSLVWSKTLTPAPSPAPEPGTPMYVEGVPCDASKAQAGFSFDAASGAIKTSDGLCFDSTISATIQAKACTGSPQQKWVYDAKAGTFTQNNHCLDVWDFAGPRVDLFGCNGGTNQKFDISPTGVIESQGKRCLELTPNSPGGGPTGGSTLQLWAKPVEDGVAILLINAASFVNATTAVTLADLNVTGTVKLRDVWNHKDAGTATTSFDVTVPAEDSIFMVLSPE